MKDSIKDLSFKEKIKLFTNKDFILFIFCGGMGTLTNFIISSIISFNVNPIISYVIGYGSSLFVAYYLNTRLIFKNKLSFKKFIKFVISYIPNFIILFSFVCVFINILNWNHYIVYLLAAMFGLPITYLIVKFYAFTNKNKKTIINTEVEK